MIKYLYFIFILSQDANGQSFFNTSFFRINSCFSFGDCFDMNQRDNYFYIEQLKDYILKVQYPLHDAVQKLEQKITNTIPITEKNEFIDTKYIEHFWKKWKKPMCLPNDNLSKRNNYMEKLFFSYRLSVTSQETLLISKSIFANLLDKINYLADFKLSTTALCGEYCAALPHSNSTQVDKPHCGAKRRA
jgi:hypothetical protein